MKKRNLLLVAVLFLAGYVMFTKSLVLPFAGTEVGTYSYSVSVPSGWSTKFTFLDDDNRADLVVYRVDGSSFTWKYFTASGRSGSHTFTPSHGGYNYSLIISGPYAYYAVVYYSNGTRHLDVYGINLVTGSHSGPYSWSHSTSSGDCYCFGSPLGKVVAERVVTLTDRYVLLSYRLERDIDQGSSTAVQTWDVLLYFHGRQAVLGPMELMTNDVDDTKEHWIYNAYDIFDDNSVHVARFYYDGRNSRAYQVEYYDLYPSGSDNVYNVSWNTGFGSVFFYDHRYVIFYGARKYGVYGTSTFGDYDANYIYDDTVSRYVGRLALKRNFRSSVYYLSRGSYPASYSVYGPAFTVPRGVFDGLHYIHVCSLENNVVSCTVYEAPPVAYGMDVNGPDRCLNYDAGVRSVDANVSLVGVEFNQSADYHVEVYVDSNLYGTYGRGTDYVLVSLTTPGTHRISVSAVGDRLYSLVYQDVNVCAYPWGVKIVHSKEGNTLYLTAFAKDDRLSPAELNYSWSVTLYAGSSELNTYAFSTQSVELNLPSSATSLHACVSVTDDMNLTTEHCEDISLLSPPPSPSPPATTSAPSPAPATGSSQQSSPVQPNGHRASISAVALVLFLILLLIRFLLM